jgi:hypothetical protein
MKIYKVDLLINIILFFLINKTDWFIFYILIYSIYLNILFLNKSFILSILEVIIIFQCFFYFFISTKS